LLTPDGTVVDANQAALDFAGVSQSAVIGKLFWDTPWWRHSAAEQTRLKDAIQRAARGQFVRYETTHPGSDGVTRAIDFSLKPVRDERGQVVMLIPEGRDITGIRQTEAALRETQERYARLAEAAFDGIGVFEDGVLVEANERFARMMGYEMLEILGKRNVELAASESADLILNQQLSSGEILCELVGKRKDGSTFPAEVHGVQVQSHGKFVRVAAIRDISERKKAEQALRDSERHFQRLAQATFEGICVTENGVILDANEQLARMGGYGLPELLGRPAIEFVAPQSHETVRWNFLHGDGKPYEILGLRKDGSTYPVEVRGHEELWDGRTIRVTALRDLTMRKQAEESLRESEERFAKLAEAAFEGIAITIEGVVQDANEQMAWMFGYSLGELIGVPAGDLVASESRELLLKNIFSGNEEPSEYVGMRKDGSRFPVEVRARMLPYKGQMVRVSILRDLTQYKRAEQALRESEERFRLIAEQTGQMIYELDISTGRQQWAGAVP
jgi:PAS domain S-box-containing protein